MHFFVWDVHFYPIIQLKKLMGNSLGRQLKKLFFFLVLNIFNGIKFSKQILPISSFSDFWDIFRHLLIKNEFLWLLSLHANLLNCKILWFKYIIKYWVFLDRKITSFLISSISRIIFKESKRDWIYFHCNA